MHRRRSTYASIVLVRRVFRGPKNLQNSEVIIENLGNLRICLANPKLGDTRIFFTDSIKPGRERFPKPQLPHFNLRSSLLRLTLSNLRVLWQLKNQKGKPKKVQNFEGRISF